MLEGSSTYSKFVLALLLAAYASNQWTRYLIAYLYSMSPTGYYADGTIFANDTCALDDKADCYITEEIPELTASAYGYLTGFAFIITFSLAGLVAGRLADSMSRVLIIVAGLLIWNGATFLQGAAQSLEVLFLARITMGLGQALSNPASYSLIADYFPADIRAEANGVFAFGVYVGGGLSSLSIIMAEDIGWRWTNYVIAFFGGGLAVVMFVFVREPSRKSKEEAVTEDADSAAEPEEVQVFTMAETIRVTFSNPIVNLLFAASAVRFMAGYILGFYLPSYFSSNYPDKTDEYSALNASCVAIGGAMSAYLGGYASDRWEKSGYGKAKAMVPFIGCVSAIPMMFLVLVTGNFYVSITALFFEYVVAECWFGPALATMQAQLPKEVRAFAISTFLFFCNIFGSAAAAIVGAWVDTLDDDSQADIKWGVLVGSVLCYGVAAVLFFVMARMLPETTASNNERAPLATSLMNDERQGSGTGSDGGVEAPPRSV